MHFSWPWGRGALAFSLLLSSGRAAAATCDPPCCFVEIEDDETKAVICQPGEICKPISGAQGHDCLPSPPHCNADEDCGEGRICKPGGFCSCATSADCGDAGQVCDGNGVCFVACQEDSECTTPGFVCDETAGRCDLPACNTDTQCAFSFCDVDGGMGGRPGRCATPGACVVNFHCSKIGTNDSTPFICSEGGTCVPSIVESPDPSCNCSPAALVGGSVAPAGAALFAFGLMRARRRARRFKAPS